MSFVTWGARELKALWGTYRPPHADAGVVEIVILPDLADTSKPASVLQQSGRKRKEIKFDGFVTAQADYDDLLDAYFKQEASTFEGPDSLSLTCTIRFLSEPEYAQDGLIFYSIVFVEA